MATQRSKVAKAFLTIAAQRLPPALYQELYDLALANVVPPNGKAPIMAEFGQIADKVIAKRSPPPVETDLKEGDDSGCIQWPPQVSVEVGPSPPPKPAEKKRHVAQRAAQRLNLELTNQDLCALRDLIVEGGPAVRPLRRKFEITVECEVQYLGTTFVVLFNEQRKWLITAYRKAKRRQHYKNVPKDEHVYDRRREKHVTVDDDGAEDVPSLD